MPPRGRFTHARALLASTVVAALALGAGAASGATSSQQASTHDRTTSAPSSALRGLPHVSTGHRPGPDILYAKPAHAPQLDNRGIWHAKPILVSGAAAYRDGEWLYQDFLYDDHGATGTPDPNNPYGAGPDLFSPPAGSYTYPTDKRYADNAADLVELRVKPLAKATAFRVTLNTLKDPQHTAFTLALGASKDAVAWPFNSGVRSPAQVFATWHGSKVFLEKVVNSNVAISTTLGTSVDDLAHVDTARRQVTVRVPHRWWNPGTGTGRVSVGVGLWDEKADDYLKPSPGPATATTPGGGTPNGIAIVNIGPRLHEPLPLIAGATIADTAVGGQVEAMFWRERQQSEQLTTGDVTPFAANVDFGKLAHRITDNSDVPKTGPIDRILASHYSFGQGYDGSKVCYDLAAGFSAGAKCIGRMVGQLQPYALYVPKKAAPKRGYGMTLLLHSLSANYNQYLGSHNQSQLGDRGPGSVILTPSGRGPDGFYAGIAEADTFEAWADVARHYKLDPDWTTVSGYSMGGFGTYRLLARWPDLFARGFSVVGAPGSVNDQLISLRNTPLLLWNATADELVNINTSEAAVKADAAARIPFTEDLFLTADHLTLAANDEYAPGAAFLGTHLVDRNPAAVSYVVDTSEDSALARTVADHAYWLSGLTPRGKGNATVVVVPNVPVCSCVTVTVLKEGAGVLTGGEIPAMAYRSRTSSGIPSSSKDHTDALAIDARNLAAMTIDPRRAHVSCAVQLTVKTDGPLTIHLAGCDRTVHAG